MGNERGGYEYRGGAGGTFLIDFHADGGGKCDITFKSDYVAILLHGCPDCCTAPYDVIVPPLIGKVPIVALFDSVGACGRPQVERLHAQGVTVLVSKTLLSPESL